MLPGKHKLKQGNTTHLSEWPKPKTQDEIEDVEQWELSFIAGGNTERYHRFDSFAVS